MTPKPTNMPEVHEPTAVTVTPPTEAELGAKIPAHCQPCPPSFTLDAPLRWKTANSLEQKVLQNLQGNILKGHGRERTWNIFFTLGADRLKSRRFLRELGNYHVTDAYTQLLTTEAFKANDTDGGTFCAAFLSAAGYTQLGLTFTAPAGNTAFAPGMKAQSSLGALTDPPTTAWEPPFRGDLHGLVIVADDDLARGSVAVARVQSLLVKAGGAVIHTQIGKAIRNPDGNGLEHFGYVDGRSQPLMLLEDIEKESRDEGIAHWDPAFPLSTALVPDPLANDPDKLSFGSFFVFRKLEQRVKDFKTREQDLADKLGLTGEDRERAGALIVGRFEDGTPVTMSAEAKGLPSPHNDFNYRGDDQASRCPFHAHIRKTNPRGSGGLQPQPAERLHIMARRGITYEDQVRVIHPSALPEAETRQEFLDEVAVHLPEDGVGLLFMAYNAKLDDQFVFTQRFWANNLSFPGDPHGPLPPGGPPVPPRGIDGVIGQGQNLPAGQAYPVEWDNNAAGSRPLDFHGFVTMKGGEYFFAPSLRFLRDL